MMEFMSLSPMVGRLDNVANVSKLHRQNSKEISATSATRANRHADPGVRSLRTLTDKRQDHCPIFLMANVPEKGTVTLCHQKRAAPGHRPAPQAPLRSAATGLAVPLQRTGWRRVG